MSACIGEDGSYKLEIFRIASKRNPIKNAWGIKGMEDENVRNSGRKLWHNKLIQHSGTLSATSGLSHQS